MKQGNKRDGANDGKDWRERPIGADDIHRAQVLEHVYVPQEPIWPFWAATFRSASASVPQRPFTQFFVPADDPWPTLPYGGTDPESGCSAAQNEALALTRERLTRASAVTLGLARVLVTMLGLASQCERHACGRVGACIGDRTREEWAHYPGPAWPPCVWNWKRAQIVRPAVERLIDRLDVLVEARLTARLGQPWTAVEAIGLTHLPEEEFHAALKAMVEESETRAKVASVERIA